MSIRSKRFAGIGIAFIVAVGAASASRAAETGFLGRFDGSWAGSGAVVKDNADLLRFSCNASAEPQQNHIVIQGNCRAFIGSYNFTADLTFDPASGRYAGTYVGHKVGPARLSGERDGNVVHLTIIWPKPVHGDTVAKMVIENAGQGIVKITIADNLSPGGPVARTAFVLAQS